MVVGDVRKTFYLFTRLMIGFLLLFFLLTGVRGWNIFWKFDMITGLQSMSFLQLVTND